ncbi:MAG: hypothetical protein IKP31_03420 [Lachnospiraceae bacterium]|nr:hypothetical protein [Lachnospiraceae bacterium]
MKPLFPLRVMRPADGGFCVSLGLGSGILFFFVWFVCAVFHIPFNSVSCISIFAVFCTVILLFKGKRGDHTAMERVLQQQERKLFFAGFAIFSILLFVAFWVKGFKPIIDFQTEQYMDYGFMNAMYRQQRLPFEDMWFAGRPVNYYYLGQAVAVLFCRLSLTSPEYGYNLMLCTLFASLGLSVFVLVEAFLNSFPNMKKRFSVTGGVMASLMCTCGANGHWIIYGIFETLWNKLRGVTADKPYWFSYPTSFIGREPDSLDKGKHEFPSYTFLLGDLHAHVCNMLFTIAFMIFLIDYALSQPDRRKTAGDEMEDEDIYTFFRDVFDYRLVIMGLILGMFRGVNYWDFPIYYVVAGAVILFCDIKEKGFRIITVLNVLVKGLFIYLTGMLAMLPFSLNYMRPDSGLHLCDRHSPPDKFIIVWFVHIIIVLTLLIYIFVRVYRNRLKSGGNGFMKQELIIIAVSLCGLGLLFMPEIIYIKDIYGDAYQRYNTMFKLTYQGFILLSISSGICIGMLLNENVKGRRIGVALIKASGVLFGTMAILLSLYMGWSVKVWFGNILDPSLRKGISVDGFIKDDPGFLNIREAIDIINSDDDRLLHIVEEAGNSYKPEDRLSAFTGAATVAGWYVHEYVWRNDVEAIRERQGEVRYFYESGDTEYCLEFLEKYGIDYIYVGPPTVEKYEVNYEGFTSLGECIWSSDDGQYMLIRVD